MNSPALPILLGKHTVLGAIGRGGMADVYLAMAHGPSGVRKLVVIKCVRAGHDLDGSLARMFLDEGRVAALLNHANVVHTYEVGESRDGAYIVMEYLHGQTLSALWRAQKPMDPGLAARLAADALSGLHYAHELRDLDGTPLSLVHRDLSPPNIFVTYDGVVKLMDFGIAKTAIATRASTEAGLVKGKLAYMAPEQATSGVVDRRADIYALGVVLWELLAGRRLVEDLSPASIIERSLHGNAPLVSSVRAEIDPELERIVSRALERDPEARYSTALEMREDLDAVLARGTAATAKQLSSLMAQLFDAQREQREQQLRAWAATCTPNEAEVEVLTRSAVLNVTPTGRVSESSPSTAGATAVSPRHRLVRGVLLGAVLLLSITAFAFYSGKTSSTGPSAATSAAASGTGSSTPLAVPAPGPAHSASASHQMPADSSVAASATQSSAVPPRPPARSALTSAATFPTKTKSKTLPARPAPPKPQPGPTLESNPYLHSQ